MTERLGPSRPRAALIAVVAGVFGQVPAHAADVAWVARINGAPAFQRAGTTRTLQRGDALGVGDVIQTDGRSKVKVLLADDSILDIGPKSQVTLDTFVLGAENRSVRLTVLTGRFKLAIARFFSGRTDYEIHTPTALAGVRGTVLWGDTDLDAICALDGSIEVRPLATHAETQLVAGDCVHKMGAGKAMPFKPSAADLAAYLKEVTPE